jgi:kynurenine formamidase
MDSGWYKHVKNVTKFLGNDKGDKTRLKFPGFHPGATKWLLDNREIYALGVDTVSLDYAGSTQFLTHRLALGRNIIGLENVNNLDKIPEAGTMIYAFPIYIKNGTGGPTRIIAMWDSGACRQVIGTMLMISVTVIALLI